MSTKKKSKSNSSSVPAPNKADNGPSIRIVYDVEAYTKHYNHMAATLTRVFPTLRCFGQKATPTLKGMLLAFSILVLQGLLALSVFYGEAFLLDHFGIALEFHVSQFIKDYQMMILLPIAFITPIMQYVARNGKYEVYYNGTTIFLQA
ncbi:hypothetical protein DYB32_004118 [Aphanomyces invadans]|uniref:Uncharacterized protein n=1 Tax=Aphanomyces invadans TaxID=157072 RepID=A0A3R6YAS5_9STRA|nr:hypothetical protein DYB32_004118 [Aphanomyces invadans]